jgi:hypothetical protein
LQQHRCIGKQSTNSTHETIQTNSHDRFGIDRRTGCGGSYGLCARRPVDYLMLQKSDGSGSGVSRSALPGCPGHDAGPMRINANRSSSSQRKGREIQQSASVAAQQVTTRQARGRAPARRRTGRAWWTPAKTRRPLHKRSGSRIGIIEDRDRSIARGCECGRTGGVD